MESFIFSKLANECLHNIKIPLHPHESIFIHLIKTPDNSYVKTILYSDDYESEIHNQYYIDTEYLFFRFLIETDNIIEIKLILEYDREQETFIHV